MSESGDWTPYFENVQRVPGSKYQQPAKKTYEELARDTEFARNRYGADVAVSLGGVDPGDGSEWWQSWLADWGGDITSQLTENVEAIANLESITAAMNTTQAYVGDKQDMVSVPRFALGQFGYGSQKWINVLDGVYCAFDDHFHNVGCPVIKPAITFGATTGVIYYTPIVVDRVGVVDKLRWIVGSDASLFSVDYYEMALCVYNPTNGNIEKVWGSGDIKDAEASTTTLTEVEVAMGIDQQCSPGQILFVAHQQVAPGLFQASRTFAAVPQPNIARPSSLVPLDSSCYRTSSAYSQGIPSSIEVSSLARENRYIPYTAVSVVAIEGP